VSPASPSPTSPPPLPRGAPADLVAFVDCGGETVELADGKPRWLPHPPGIGSLLTPKVTIRTAGSADQADITVGWSIARLRLRARVEAGCLRVEPHGRRVPLLGDVYEGIGGWVDKLNAWLAVNGRRVGGLSVATGVLRLTKATDPGRRRSPNAMSPHSP
jgi:hypothetical protein